MPVEKNTPAYVLIPNRGQLRVRGADSAKFLQGLISNDIHKLETEPALYAALLSAQGKFLHDFIITRDDEGYSLDCEGGERTHDLLKRLSLYKLRADVTLTAEPEIPIYVIFGQPGISDPRHPALGVRTLQKPDLPALPFSEWDTIRIRLAIADGSRDAEIGKSTLEELNMAATAVSFDKGCYVGQELTARMEHRGLAKRHLVALGLNMPYPAFGEELMLNSRPIGTMRSVCGSVGLALLRDDALELLRETHDQSPLYLLG